MDDSQIANTQEDFRLNAHADNWRKHEYGVRFIDSLASLFAVYSPCCAALFNKQKSTLYISFNNEAFYAQTRKKSAPIEKLTKVIKETLFVGELKDILFLYLAYNDDLLLSLTVKI